MWTVAIKGRHCEAQLPNVFGTWFLTLLNQFTKWMGTLDEVSPAPRCKEPAPWISKWSAWHQGHLHWSREYMYYMKLLNFQTCHYSTSTYLLCFWCTSKIIANDHLHLHLCNIMLVKILKSQNRTLISPSNQLSLVTPLFFC